VPLDIVIGDFWRLGFIVLFLSFKLLFEGQTIVKERSIIFKYSLDFKVWYS